MTTQQKKPSAARHGFKQGEAIVYPAHGVGTIAVIEEQEVAGMKLELFVIDFEKDKMRLKVPVAKAVSIGMRKLSETDFVERALHRGAGGTGRRRRAAVMFDLAVTRTFALRRSARIASAAGGSHQVLDTGFKTLDRAAQRIERRPVALAGMRRSRSVHVSARFDVDPADSRIWACCPTGPVRAERRNPGPAALAGLTVASLTGNDIFLPVRANRFMGKCRLRSHFTKRGKQPVNFWSVFFNERLPKAGAAGESAVRTEFAGAFYRSKTVAQV